MRASRTDDSRRVDWSKVKGTEDERLAKLGAQVVRFVGGIRGPRKTEVTKGQILRWFHGTPPEFVGQAISNAVVNDKIRCPRTDLRHGRRQPGYVYEIVAKRGEMTADEIDKAEQDVDLIEHHAARARAALEKIKGTPAGDPAYESHVYWLERETDDAAKSAQRIRDMAEAVLDELQKASGAA